MERVLTRGIGVGKSDIFHARVQPDINPTVGEGEPVLVEPVCGLTLEGLKLFSIVNCGDGGEERAESEGREGVREKGNHGLFQARGGKGSWTRWSGVKEKRDPPGEQAS